MGSFRSGLNLHKPNYTPYLFPQIGDELDLNNSQLALLVSATAIAWAISSLIFSAVSDRIGRRKWIIVGSIVLFSLTVCFIGAARNFVIMVVLRALIGFFEGPALPVIQSAVASVSSPSRRGRNLGIVIAGTSVIGTALAPSIMIGLATAFGWRAAFPFVGGAGIVVAILVTILYKEPASGDATSGVRMADFRRVITNRNVLLAIVGTALLIGYTVGFSAFATRFLASNQYSGGQIALVLTAFGISSALGSIIAPSLSDRIGRRPALGAALACAAAVPLSFLALHGSIALLTAATEFGLLGGGALTILTYVVPADSVPPGLASTAFAVQLAVGETVGGSLGPQIGGAIADQTGSLNATMVFYAVLPVLAIAIAVLFKETAPTPPRDERG